MPKEKNIQKYSRETLNLRLLDSHKIPLKYQEFKLFEVIHAKRYLIDKIFTTDEKGECSLNTKEIFQDKALSFELKLNHSSYYKDKSIFHCRRIPRSYEYGHWCEFKFEKKVDNFSIKRIEFKPKEFLLNNNEKIIRNFHKNGDILEFEAFYDEEKIKEEYIKWGYIFIERSEILDKLNKNQLTNDKKENSLFDNEILKNCYQIENIGNNPMFSTSLILKLEENTKAYHGKTIKTTLPQYNTSSQEQQALLIFAYKDTPNYRASQLIRINDYPQITIDCTLAEVLRAHVRGDEVLRLGWGVSYICQRLWHDNPANAKELGELIYIDSKSQDFIDSIPNETMKTIVKDILLRVEMKEFGKDTANQCPKIKSQIQENDEKNLRFYIELDWDEFYMKFPLMKGLEKEALSITTPERNKNIFKVPITAYELGKILTNNFLDSLSGFWAYDHATIKQAIQLNKDSETFSMRVTANLLEIAKNPKEANIPNANNKVFSIANDSTKLQECERLLSDIKPSDLRRHQMQYYGFSDTDFIGLNAKENIALYALSGKFQIYYVLDKFEVEKLNESKIAIYPTQIKAYIDDSFDFRDQPMQFVGAWDYENVEFKAFYSGVKNFIDDKNATKEIDNNIMRNLDYQNTQKNFNLGLDFIVTSQSFKNLKIPNDYLSKRFYTRYFKLLD